MGQKCVKFFENLLKMVNLMHKIFKNFTMGQYLEKVSDTIFFMGFSWYPSFHPKKLCFNHQSQFFLDDSTYEAKVPEQ
jgi:hypothetical protein